MQNTINAIGALPKWSPQISCHQITQGFPGSFPELQTRENDPNKWWGSRTIMVLNKESVSKLEFYNKKYGLQFSVIIPRD